MKRLCDLFNQHRDGMLDSEQKVQFELHLASCEECRTRFVFLDNLVDVVRNQKITEPIDRPERIADCAYERTGSWDFLLLSWLKPLPVWAGLALLLVFLTFLWSGPSTEQPKLTANYEDIMMNGNQSDSAAAYLSDAELETWLEQGGTIK
jgi:hypothetical protein